MMNIITIHIAYQRLYKVYAYITKYNRGRNNAYYIIPIPVKQKNLSLSFPFWIEKMQRKK